MSKILGVPDIVLFLAFLSPLAHSPLLPLALRFSIQNPGDPCLRWCWRGSAARRGRKRRREEDRPLLQSSERRFFFLPAREPKPSEAKEKFRKQKASFGAHAHRHLCAPARLYLYRSPSPRVKGLVGSSARGRREQLSDGRERESARPEKTVSLFAPKARGEKKEPNFPHGRNAPRSPSLVPSCFSLSLHRSGAPGRARGTGSYQTAGRRRSSLGPRSPPRPRRAAAQSPRRQSGASSRRNRRPLPRSSRSSRAPDRGRGAPSWEGAEAGPARRWLASCWREGKDEEGKSREGPNSFLPPLFFFSSREDLEISVYGGGRGGEKKGFFSTSSFPVSPSFLRL